MAPTKHSRFREHTSPGGNVYQKTKNRRKSIRDQLRSVQRLLRQEKLPATMRVAQERILNMLESELKEKAKEGKVKKMAKKYKMVKFFELRKIQRKYNVCLKSLESCSDNKERENLDKELEQVKQQWNYITYFPTELKYVSLFPPTPCNNEEVLKKKDQLFKMINDKVNSGEFKQACDMMSPSPKEKTNRKRKSPGGMLKMGLERSTENTEDSSLPKRSLEDDFFIDTEPAREEDIKPTISSTNKKSTLTKKSKCAVLGSVDTSSHKVKRLKDDREEEATKKAKKEKKMKKSLQN